eukprot:1194656-Rhodomonas_salina.4
MRRMCSRTCGCGCARGSWPEHAAGRAQYIFDYALRRVLELLPLYSAPHSSGQSHIPPVSPTFPQSFPRNSRPAVSSAGGCL